MVLLRILLVIMILVEINLVLTKQSINMYLDLALFWQYNIGEKRGIFNLLYRLFTRLLFLYYFDSTFHWFVMKHLKLTNMSAVVGQDIHLLQIDFNTVIHIDMFHVVFQDIHFLQSVTNWFQYRHTYLVYSSTIIK